MDAVLAVLLTEDMRERLGLALCMYVSLRCGWLVPNRDASGSAERIGAMMDGVLLLSARIFSATYSAHPPWPGWASFAFNAASLETAALDACIATCGTTECTRCGQA
jgi:hypothetical protein